MTEEEVFKDHHIELREPFRTIVNRLYEVGRIADKHGHGFTVPSGGKRTLGCVFNHITIEELKLLIEYKENQLKPPIE